MSLNREDKSVSIEKRQDECLVMKQLLKPTSNVLEPVFKNSEGSMTGVSEAWLVLC